MSRVAYAALGKRGSFSRDTRYTAPPADAVPAAPTEDAAELKSASEELSSRSSELTQIIARFSGDLIKQSES